MASIDTGKELIIFIHDLSKITDSLKQISRKIETSRNNTDFRIEIYSDIIKSDEFKKIIDFCENIEVIKNNIYADYSRLVKERRRFFLSMGVTIFGIIITIIGVIEKAPDFLRWLSKFYPALNNFI